MTQQMPNSIPLYGEAARGFRAMMAAVKADQLGRNTPCTLWNVRALLIHNLKVAEFVHQLFTTGQSDEDDSAVGGPLPKEGAVAAFDGAVSRVLGWIKAPGAIDKQLNTPFGQMSAGQFLMFPTLDLLIHRWDLAKGIGQDTTLPAHLVEACLGLAPGIEGGRSMGVFGPAVAVPAHARAQDRLLGLTGRHP